MEGKETITPGTTKTEMPKKKKKNLVIIIGLLILLAGAVAVILYQKDESDKRAAELKDTYFKLDSIGGQLVEKINEIERLGGDIHELEAARDSLEKEKEFLRKDANYAHQRIQKLNTRLEGYKELLVAKDAEIEQLKAINENLVAENTDLKVEKNQLTKKLQDEQKVQEKLNEKVAIASRLEAENINIKALNNKGKEREGEFRARQLEKLKVDFNIARNDVAPIEGKVVYIRVIDGNDNVIFDVAKGSGTFILDGKETFYTAKQEILFDNSQQHLTFIYEKGSEYALGRYEVEIYTDGYLMGKESFRVK